MGALTTDHVTSHELHEQDGQTSPRHSQDPVFGLILMGGSVSGALIRDVRLANELADRGFGVYIWWAMDRQRQMQIDERISQHWLFHGMRYRWPIGAGMFDAIGRMMARFFDDKKRAHALQQRPDMLNRLMQGLLSRVYRGVEHDTTVLKRFAREIADAGVTHVLPMLGVLCPWALALRGVMDNPPRYLVTFQGYELYSNYARSAGTEQQLLARFREVTEQSVYQAICVSKDYVSRVTEDIGIDSDRLAAIPPGVPISPLMDRNVAGDLVRRGLKKYDPALPLVTFLGRRDSEKGIDLLLYAAKILAQRGLKFQLAVCGPTLFGSDYGLLCKQIAQNLRLPVLWRKQVTDRLRDALFTVSRCVVYPSIHREPFGMVPVEALARGTPAIVPDHGGVAHTIEADDHVAGLRFRVWDSGDLANQIEKMLTDDDLHARFTRAAPKVAQYYSVQKLADRVLAHMGLAPTPQHRQISSE